MGEAKLVAGQAPEMTGVTARGFRPTQRTITVVLVGVMVALVGFLALSAALAGPLSLSKLWSAAGLFVSSW
ncbi:MAG TPA: hypothetical protein VIX86_18645 [Streptosporangiaceae bacterium]